MASYLLAYLGGDGKTDVYNSVAYGAVFGGSGDSLKKVFLWNVGTQAMHIQGSFTTAIDFTTSDLMDYLSWQADPGTPGSGATLTCPYSVAASVVPSGGSLSAWNTYYYRVTAKVNEQKETTGSIEQSVTLVSGASNSVLLTWSPVVGASGYAIYRSTTAGVLYTSGWIGSTTGVSFIDTGTSGAPTLPAANNTAGSGAPNYCDVPPTSGWTTAALDFGSIQPGEQKVLWLRINAPTSVSETANPRQGSITFTVIT